MPIHAAQVCVAARSLISLFPMSLPVQKCFSSCSLLLAWQFSQRLDVRVHVGPCVCITALCSSRPWFFPYFVLSSFPPFESIQTSKVTRQSFASWPYDLTFFFFPSDYSSYSSYYYSSWLDFVRFVLLLSLTFRCMCLSRSPQEIHCRCALFIIIIIIITTITLIIIIFIIIIFLLVLVFSAFRTRLIESFIDVLVCVCVLYVHKKLPAFSLFLLS